MRVFPQLESALEEHRGTLYRVALRLSGNEAVAQDLVQDTLLRAIEKKAAFEVGTALRAWLVTILNNRFIDQCRRERARGAHEPVDGLPLAQPLPDPPPAWASLDIDALRRATERLPKDMAEVYRLSAFEGLSYAEIAGRLGIPQNTVGTRLLRARRKIRGLLEEEGT
ncbi:MAG: RNA polymerase sigma factor [Deltaproteobacteria bacterium]|nr:RNA polymerase sigma factor [Deltaproteobacteria bacterium]